MYISKLVLKNFRNFSNATFLFKEGVNTLIGENGAGKTNVFHAMRLLLDDSLPNRIRNLTESDFNRSLGNRWRGHWIIIYTQYKGLDETEESQSLTYHSIGDLLEEKCGSYAMYFRPKKNIRKKLYELSVEENKDIDQIELLLSNISIEDYEVIFTGRGRADFSNNEIYNAYVGDFENYIFPNPEDMQLNQLGCPIPMNFSFQNSIACTFVKALRDVVADLKYGKYNPLLNLLKGTERKLEIGDKTKLIAKVSELNSDISKLNEIRQISKNISETLEGAIGRTYAPSLDIKSDLPEDIEELLQSLSLWVNDGYDNNHQGKISELSLGGANLIFLSLKLLEYQMKQSSNKIAHFLFIEEPEAHIHTHIQKTLFENIKNNNTQIIISTHSTHISSVSKISAINVLCLEDKDTKVYQPSNGLGDIEVTRIERYLDAIRSTILFAKGVVLVEGDAENIVIPQLFRKVLGISLDEIGVSLINMSSTVFDTVAKVFDDVRVKRKCAILTDNDLSILPLKTNATEDTLEERKCRDSQEAGKLRREKLDEEYNSNNWVGVFYAPHTFEVDFLMSHNNKEVINTLEGIYSQQGKIDKCKENFAKQILQLLEKRYYA